MRNIQIIDNYHQQPMNFNNTTQVNPVPVDAQDYIPVKGPDAGSVDFLWKASQELGGALFSPKTDIPLMAGAKYFGFNRRIKYLTPDSVGRDEFDLKITFPAGLQINLSNQINGGAWQVDPNDPPKWANSGFSPSLQIGWNDFMFRGSTDAATVWNIDGLAANGASFSALPANCKSIPLKKTTWGAGIHLQIQAEVQNCPAYCLIRYGQTQIIQSDSPIPLIWF